MIRWSMGSGRSDGADVKGKRVLEREKGKGFCGGVKAHPTIVSLPGDSPFSLPGALPGASFLASLGPIPCRTLGGLPRAFWPLLASPGCGMHWNHHSWELRANVTYSPAIPMSPSSESLTSEDLSRNSSSSRCIPEDSRAFMTPSIMAALEL